jgi:hypothetical protein
MAKNDNVFSIIVIPDTQDVCTSHPDKLKKMTNWIVDNAERLNVKKILHVGDVVNNGNRKEEQYVNHHEAFSKIYDANLPIMISMGNHDYDNLLDTNRDSSMFNKYCGIHLYEDKPWFGGVLDSSKAENLYTKQEINGTKYIFLSLEFGPRDEVLEWANKILEEHVDHKAIIVTHSYMYLYGERTKPGDAHNPKKYKGAHGANDGEDVWHKCIKKHDNIIAVFSGHHITDNVSYRFDAGEKGNLVFQSFQNWQCAPNGGDGRIRIATFNIDNNTIELTVYNPQTERFETDEGFSISFPFQVDSDRHEEILKIQHPVKVN